MELPADGSGCCGEPRPAAPPPPTFHSFAVDHRAATTTKPSYDYPQAAVGHDAAAISIPGAAAAAAATQLPRFPADLPQQIQQLLGTHMQSMEQQVPLNPD